MGKLDFLPTFSYIATSALSLFFGQNVNPRMLSRVISECPILTSKILLLANSTLFKGSEGSTSDLYYSINRIGLENVRDVLTAHTIRSVADKVNSDISTKQFIFHSSLAGSIAFRMAKIYKSIFYHWINEIHVSSLLHDIGIFYVYHNDSKVFDKIISFSNENNVSFYETENLLKLENHGELGARILKSCCFSNDVALLMSWHESIKDINKNIEDGGLRKAAYLVYLADTLAVRFGGNPLGTYKSTRIDSKIFEYLGLKPREVFNIVESSVEFIKQREEAFS